MEVGREVHENESEWVEMGRNTTLDMIYDMRVFVEVKGIMSVPDIVLHSGMFG